MSLTYSDKFYRIALCGVVLTGVIVSGFEIHRRDDEPFNHTIIMIVMITLFLFSLFLIERVHRIGMRANIERDEAKRQKNFLNTLLNNMPLGIFVKDAKNDFRYIMLNKMAEETFGMTDGYAFGRTDYDFFPESESNFFRDTDIRVMSGREVVEVDAEPVTSTKGVFIAHTLKVPIFDDDGNPALLLGMFEDVTERIKLEEEAHRQKTLLDTLLYSMPLGIFVKDVRQNYNYVLINKVAEGVFGMPNTQVYGKNDHYFFPKEQADKFLEMDSHVIAERKLVEIEAETVLSAEKGLFTSHTYKVPIYDDVGNPILLLGIFDDVTEKIKGQEDLRQAKEDAEKANAAKSDFLANMSHEIRTPINGVMGMAHLLKNTALDGQQRHYAESIEHSAESLLHIINDILDFSKIEAGKMEIENIEFDFQTLCEEVSELMSIRTQEKNLEFFHRFRKECPTRLIGDPGRVRQVLLNLCSNAVKFTESGYVLLDIKPLESHAREVKLQIGIHDTGIGISPDKLEKIFDKFDQADTSNTRKYGGTGLGLAISRQLVDIMGGELSVESAFGKGSSFVWTMTFALPDIKYQPAFNDNKDKFFALGLNVLVVDDNKISCEIIEDMLKAANFNVTTEHRPGSVIKALLNPLQGKKFDFVLLDYVMPFTNGVELAYEIKREPALKDLIVVLATSQPTRSDNDELKDSGIRGYLSKPVRHTDLLKMMSMLWEAKQAGRVIDMVTRYTLREAMGKKETCYQKYRDVKVLVAEDNLVNQEVMAGMLENLNIAATIVPSGRHALAALQTSNFDLVFMDCQMPDMDGFEATRLIRALPTPAAKTTIIALTANVMKGDREKCLLAGMSDYLGKPIHEEELSEMLRKWLPCSKLKSDELASMTEKKPQAGLMVESCALDLAVLEKLQRSMKDRFPFLIRTFLVNSESLVEKIERALQDRDASALREAAHSLKSSGQLGASEVYRLAAQLEDHAKKGEVEGLNDVLADLKREFSAVSLALQASRWIAGYEKEAEA